MYDTIMLRLTASDVPDVDFIAETACHLTNVGEHTYNGLSYITGDCGCLQISLSRWQVKIKGGSLCKWHLNDNFKTMGRSDTQKAIERLSDTLHLPFGKASVTRLDVAVNLLVKYPPETYFSHLGVLPMWQRSNIESGSLYYRRGGGANVLCFYDKTKEARHSKSGVPDLYQGRNILRYEQRFTQKLSHYLGAEVTGAMLYDEAFYMSVLTMWRDAYRQIQKINDVQLNFKAMKTKQHFYKAGVLTLVQQFGGEVAMIEQIKDAQRRGEITAKQSYDLRAAIRDACKLQEGLTVPNEQVTELDKKISEAIRFFR